MSRDAEERVPPKRKTPKLNRSGPSSPANSGEEPTTWQPNTKPSKAKRSSPPASERVVIPAGPSWWERILFGRVGTGQLAAFCRQFAAYLDAGVDLNRALDSLQQQFSRTGLGPVLGRLRAGVRQGDTLAEIMAREPQAFDPLFLSMIKVAEARGGVPETLRMLAKHYEARLSLIRQARSAMIYPIIVLVIASGVVALMTKFILPMFVSLLRDIAGRGAQLPLASRVLMGFSQFVETMGWWLIPIVMVGVPFLLFRIYRTAPGKTLMDETALWIPGIGMLLRKLDTTRMARTLATLLESGVDIGQTLDLTAEVVRLAPYRRAIRHARAAVVQGEELSESLQASGRFSVDVIAVINSGEETGKLPETLDKLADDYEEQVTYMVKNLGQLVQPLLMIMMGALVLFIILAVILPYIAILTSLSR